jgi:60 kDa SS-A/Ro ribonucleoprotein
MTYADLYNPNKTPQSEKAAEGQAKNHAGGFAFTIDKWARLDRFLILGSDAPTYYQSARELTRQNGSSVLACYAEDVDRTVKRIVEISEGGLAPKNDPAIFALALGAQHKDFLARQLALSNMYKVCRTGTHLFMFVSMARKLGKGWGRAMKRAVAEWYDKKDVDKVAYQAIKYRNREGYTHKRLLQCAHPTGGVRIADGTGGMDRDALYRWIVEKEYEADYLPSIVCAHLAAMAFEGGTVSGIKNLMTLINEHKLPWEALPTWALTDPIIWETMLPHLGLTAVIRNLGNMTRIGAIKPMSNVEQMVVSRLGDERMIETSRVHPFSVLQALAVYQQGRGFRGSGEWDPSRAVIDALDGAFYKAFKNVEPTGKRILLALDVSGSIIMGSPLSAREGSAAMALITMAAEKNTHVVGFTAKAGGGYLRDAELTPLNISPRQRLDDVVRTVARLPFGATDCSLPMVHALKTGLAVDAFVVYTDNETWAGDIHPFEALKEYRAKTGIDAKLVVVGMTSTDFSIADPNDAGMLDVVGFDSSAPAVISNFIGG